MTSFSSKKFIVWDWNGTVIDDVHAAHQAFNEAMIFMTKSPVTLEQYREAYDFPLTKLFMQLGLLAEELEKNLASMMVVFHRHFENLSRSANIRQNWSTLHPLFVERKFSNVILSNHLTEMIQGHAAHLGIAQQFDHILANGNQEEQLRKLSKGERLHQYMEKHDLSGQNGIIIGDTPEEAHIGRELGMPSVLITGGYASQTRLEAAAPAYLIHSFTELTPLLHEKGYLS